MPDHRRRINEACDGAPKLFSRSELPMFSEEERRSYQEIAKRRLYN
jgi:hypothetical protein